MKTGNIFIRNPYLAMVIAIVIVLCGVLALLQMPLSQYPNVTPPQITVSVTYPGADAQTLLESVIIPLEKQINGAPDLLYLNSVAANSGTAIITATFKLGSIPEINQQNVQDRVDWANAQLPEAVQKEGVIVRQQSGNILLGISLYSQDDTYDTLFMSNYASINLVDSLARIPGVAQVELFGGSDYAMRIWVDPAKCAALQLPIQAIADALQSQNMQITAGGIGQAPSGNYQRFAYDVLVRGRLPDAESFRNIIVRTAGNGAQLKLSDVAEIELGDAAYATKCALNGHPATILMIFQNSGANGLAIDSACRNYMAKAAKNFPPDLQYGFQYDSTTFVRDGIDNVVITLLIAVGLVAITSLIFLQDWRMALIPTIAIPVSIIGTFAVLKLAGFSVNMITLFALTLAIGIVVDDAIIVIENVSRLMDEEHLPPMEAAAKSMTQITGAVVATTAVLLAMFLPLCFFPGITGELYREFGVTLSIAVAISAFNALSLSPALSGLILREHNDKRRKFFLFVWFNDVFSVFARGARKLLHFMLHGVVAITIVYLLLAGLIFYLYSQRPTGFIPQEDQGYFFCALQSGAGASLNRSAAASGEVGNLLRQLPGVSDVIEIPGFNILNSTPAERSSFLVIILKPWQEREAAKLNSQKIMEMAQFESLTKIPNVLCMFFQPPAIPGIGMAGGFNLVLEERTGTDSDLLSAMVEAIQLAALRDPKLSNVFSAYSAGTPAVYLKIDREKAMRLGVAMSQIDAVLQNELGFTFINQFNRFGQVYKVELQAQSNQRQSVESILNLHVLNNQAQAVPFSAIATPIMKFSPDYLNRYNLHLAAQIQGNPAAGVSSSEAMNAISGIVDKIIPESMSYEWTDMSYQEMNEGNKGPFILLLSVIFIFLFLAALYQSWLLPFSVLPVIPVALAGALTALFIGNINNNIYTQIGLILLFGMACKTSILVVDFAKQRHQSGVSALEAACYAQKLRFRAVLMTALAFTLGTLPLAISNGPGSAGECSIGIPVVGGMVGTLIGGVLLSPIFYVVISKRRPKINSAARMNLILLAGLMLLSGCYTPPLGGALVTAKSIAEAKTKTPPQPENMTLLTRADAIRLALENNTDYRSAGLAINSAKMRYFQALGAYSPSLTAGGGVGQQIYGGENHTSKENNQNFFGNAQNSTTFYTYGGVQANVLIFNGLAREFEVVAAQHKVKQSDFLNENARRILIQSVLLAYDEVLSAQNQCKIAQSDRNFIQEELNQAKIKLRVGNLPELDVLSLTGQLQQAEINVAKAENGERIARFALTLLLGYVDCAWLEQVPLLADWQSDFANEKINAVDYYLNCALTNRPDLNALRSSLDAQRVLFYQRYSSFSPEIIGSANYTYSNADSLNSGGIGNFLINGNSFNYGGFAFWNIFDGFTRYNKLREGRLELDQAYLKGSAQWLQIVNEVRSAHSDTLYALRWSSLAAAQRDTMLQERNMLSREYHVGNAPLIRFQQAQTNYINSEYELLNSRIAYHKATIRLLAAAALNGGMYYNAEAGKITQNGKLEKQP